MLKKRKNRLIVLALIIFFVSLVNLFFSVYIGEKRVLEKRTFYMRVIVSNKTGIDLNSSAIIFGMVLPGSSSTRSLLLENKYNKDVEVDFSFDGNISEFIKVERGIIKAGETKSLGVSVVIPKNQPYGVYEGNLTVILKIP